MAPTTSEYAHQPAKKRGPQPKSLSERVPRKLRVTPIRPQQTRSRERKIEVLSWIYHHRIVAVRQNGRYQLPRVQDGLQITSEQKPDGQIVYYRPPTYAEASEFWKIPVGTIQRWWKDRDKIIEKGATTAAKKGTKSSTKSSTKSGAKSDTKSREVPL